jgi:hypothetical protein
LVSDYANHTIIQKEIIDGQYDGDGNQKYKVLFKLPFRNGRLVMSRKEFEKLKKIAAFNTRVGYGKRIGVLGDTNIVPKSVPIPEVVQSVEAKQIET